MFYAQDEIRENLKSISNRSELINQLLRDHFKRTSIETLPLDEQEKVLLKELQIKKIEIEALKKIEEVENGNV